MDDSGCTKPYQDKRRRISLVHFRAHRVLWRMLLPLSSPLNDHIDSARASGQNENMVGFAVAGYGVNVIPRGVAHYSPIVSAPSAAPWMTMSPGWQRGTGPGA
jgi:hypothetical protein